MGLSLVLGMSFLGCKFYTGFLVYTRIRPVSDTDQRPSFFPTSPLARDLDRVAPPGGAGAGVHEVVKQRRSRRRRGEAQKTVATRGVRRADDGDSFLAATVTATRSWLRQ